MKAPVLFEEMPPTSSGSIIGLGLGLAYVVVKYGFHSPFADATLVAITSLGILVICFWAMRCKLAFWMTACSTSAAYLYLVAKHYISLKGNMSYELYPHIVMLSVIQTAIMYAGGTVIRARQANG